MDSLYKKLLILRSPNIGSVKYFELLSKFKTLDNIVDFIKPSDLVFKTVDKELETANKLNIKFIENDSFLYPKNLSELRNQPVILTVRGNISTLNKKSVSIVGTRHASVAGIKIASNLAEAFADNNYCVISGMAIGTDTYSHIGALKSKGDSNTIAILAGGIDYIWPKENEKLYYQIVEKGLIISEMPIGFKPQKGNFIQRNRIIAGLCDKFIIGEADEKSGSMSTARFAIEYKKDVYAIPSHPTDNRSFGPNSLIQNGKAKLCNGVKTFFDKKEEIKKDLSSDLLNALSSVPVSESVLTSILGKTISSIKSELVILESKGLVIKQNGGYIKI